jgi:integrase
MQNKSDQSVTSPLEPLGTLGGLSLLEAVADFLATKNSLDTRRTYAGTLADFFRAADVRDMRALHPRRLPPGEVSRLARAYLDSLTRRHSEDLNRILNPRTVNTKAAALSSFFRWLCAVHGYPHNPIQPIHKPHKTPKLSNTESLSRGEIVDLLKYAEGRARNREKDFRDYLILLFAFGLALRRAEIVRLRWDDIGTLNALNVVAVYRKGGKPETQPLPDKIARLLADFRARFPTDSAYIFRPVRNRATGDLDKPLTTDAVFDVIRLTTLALFPEKNITPHSLRKTFIELALAEGEDFHAIMNATGLARMEMVRYYDGRDQVENNAIRGISKLL